MTGIWCACLTLLLVQVDWRQAAAADGVGGVAPADAFGVLKDRWRPGKDAGAGDGLLSGGPPGDVPHDLGHLGRGLTGASVVPAQSSAGGLRLDPGDPDLGEGV